MYLRAWKTLICTTEYLFSRITAPSTMESAFSLLSQKEKEIRKIQENKMRLKFPRFAGKKINIIPDSV